jgi:predicted PurR-regulated permease PerM
MVKPHEDLDRPAGRWTMAVLTVLAVVLLALVIRPFASALFIAAVLAGAFHPWTASLTRRLRGRKELAAGLTTFAVVVIVVVPVTILAVVIGKEVASGATDVSRTLSSEGISGLVTRLPGPLQHVVEKLLGYLPDHGSELPSSMGMSGGQAAAQAVGGVLSATWSAIVQLALMVIALYFLLVDGEQLVAWLATVVPLGKATTMELLADFRQVTVTVLVSSAATTAVQTAVALVGYLIAHVPNLLLFTVLTFVVGLVPAVGAGAVTLVAAAVILLKGHTGMAVFLAIWGIVAVGLSDNVVKPYLMSGEVDMHGAVLFFALLGGLAAFGMIGILVGPLAVSFFMAVIRLRARQRDEIGI